MGIKILLALLIIIVIIGLAFVFAVTLFVSVYAQRYILFFNVSSWNALRLGSSLLRKNIGPTLFVSLICMVAAIVGGIVAIPLSLIPAGVLGLPLIVPLVQGNQPTITGIVSGVVGGTSGFLLGGTIGIIISAFVVVFQQSLWNLLFDHLTKENT